MKILISKQKVALTGAVIYTLLIGLGMFISFHVRGISYDNPKIMNTLGVVEILLTLWTLFLGMRYFSFKEAGFSSIEKKQLWWLLPSFAIIIAMIVAGADALSSKDISSEQIQQITIIGIATFLVGFSEELMYRGIVLNAFLETYSKTKAVVISAVAFSLLHSVNIFGGLAFQFMLMQLVLTFLFGLFSALIFIRIKNLIPLIIFHWLWDFCTISNGVINGESLITKIASVHLLIQFILIIVLFLFLNTNFKKTNNLIAE